MLVGGTSRVSGPTLETAGSFLLAGPRSHAPPLAAAGSVICAGRPQALRMLTADRGFPPHRVGMVKKDGSVLVPSQSMLSARHLLGCASHKRRLKCARGWRYQPCAVHSTAHQPPGRKHAQVTRGPRATPAMGTPQSPGLRSPLLAVCVAHGAARGLLRWEGNIEYPDVQTVPEPRTEPIRTRSCYDPFNDLS